MPHIPSFTIKATDSLAVQVIHYYASLCDSKGLDDQFTEVRKALAEMVAWQDAHLDQVHEPDHKHMPAGQTAVKVVDTLTVVRAPNEGHARLYIDGVPFRYATMAGFEYHSPTRERHSMPGITLTIAARRVSIEDEAFEAAKPPPGPPGRGNAIEYIEKGA